MCHGADGKGGKMGTRDFGSAEVKAESDAQLTEIITKGKAPKMPAYGEKLKETEIKELVILTSRSWPSKRSRRRIQPAGVDSKIGGREHVRANNTETSCVWNRSHPLFYAEFRCAAAKKEPT